MIERYYPFQLFLVFFIFVTCSQTVIGEQKHIELDINNIAYTDTSLKKAVNETRAAAELNSNQSKKIKPGSINNSLYHLQNQPDNYLHCSF